MEPRYVVNSVQRDGVEVFLLEDGTRAAAEIVPSLGFNLFAYSTGLPLFEAVSFADFLKKPTGYGNPLLFPFPNRVRDGAFTFRGKRYEVEPPRHGFVRDKAWRVVASGASVSEGAWIQAEIDARNFSKEILSQFSFPFTLKATYALREGALELTVVATNTGDSDMPAGFGIHPYFRKPERGSMRVPAAKRWELIDNLPTGLLVDIDRAFDLRAARDLAGLNLDDIYTDLAADASGVTRCFLSDDVTRTQTVIEFHRRDFPHVVVYTPPAPRAAICIEPNSCPTDAFNLEARGIDASVLTLAPGSNVELRVRFYSEAF